MQPRRPIRIAVYAALVTLAVAHASSTLAADESLADGARKAGRAVGSTAREAWQEGKKAGKEVGHGAANAGREIGHGAAKAGRAVGSPAREGALELKRAITGETK